MDLKKFQSIYFPRPSTYKGKRHIGDLLAIDSETLIDGRPFLFAISDGTYFDIRKIPQIFFTRKYRDRHFVCYNLKFDSGSMLYDLPISCRTRLWQKGKCRHNGYFYSYIPHKRLRISHKGNGVTFWDISQFYKTSLEKASTKYLNQHKESIPTKEFTWDYVNEHYFELVEYCKQDAKLTAELGRYFLDFLAEFDIRPNNLYSEASISFEYFKRKAGIVDCHKHWLYERDAVGYAYLAYSGGKFEVTARGKFQGYEYDISSAYPAETADLKDISNARIRFYKQYVPDADYGYLKVHIILNNDIPHTVAIKRRVVNTYPMGMFTAFITKREYEYLISKGIEVKVIGGWYIFCKTKHNPYRDVVNELYRLKQSCADKYDMKGTCAKIMLNGFYGKMLQLVKMPDGRLRAGPGFNPFYAAEITANTRIKISDLQAQLGRKCLATHTDSVISTGPIPQGYIGNKLGDFQLTRTGPGVIIASGMYQIADKSAERGFRLADGNNWLDILERIGNQSKVKLSERRAMSWINAIYRNQPELTNVFKTFPKTLDLNCDRKRIWLHTTTGKRLLDGLEYSEPLIHIST